MQQTESSFNYVTIPLEIIEKVDSVIFIRLISYQ